MEKFVLSKMKSDNFSKACNEIYLLTDYNEKQYPEYYKWFYSKNIPRVLNGKGDVIFYLDGLVVAGLSTLKNDSEKKICTFYVNPEYRKKGISKRLLEDSFSYLDTDKPLITIPSSKVEDFSKIIDCYGWVQDGVIDSYNSKEYEFNNIKKMVKSL